MTYPLDSANLSLSASVVSLAGHGPIVTSVKVVPSPAVSLNCV